jgi:hypothetical protein
VEEDPLLWRFLVRDPPVDGLAEWGWEHRQMPREDVMRLANGMFWDGFKTLLSVRR